MNEPSWISCRSVLPTYEGTYLVKYLSGHVGLAFYNPDTELFKTFEKQPEYWCHTPETVNPIH